MGRSAVLERRHDLLGEQAHRAQYLLLLEVTELINNGIMPSVGRAGPSRPREDGHDACGDDYGPRLHKG